MGSETMRVNVSNATWQEIEEMKSYFEGKGKKVTMDNLTLIIETKAQDDLAEFIKEV